MARLLLGDSYSHAGTRRAAVRLPSGTAGGMFYIS